MATDLQMFFANVLRLYQKKQCTRLALPGHSYVSLSLTYPECQFVSEFDTALATAVWPSGTLKQARTVVVTTGGCVMVIKTIEAAPGITFTWVLPGVPTPIAIFRLDDSFPRRDVLATRVS